MVLYFATKARVGNRLSRIEIGVWILDLMGLKTEVDPFPLEQWLSKLSSWTSSISIWELVKNANSWAPTQTY